ncbi:MAG: STAS/SEC14 domain-containing protein [Candidatus Nanohaloarchaea archaeon]
MDLRGVDPENMKEFSEAVEEMEEEVTSEPEGSVLALTDARDMSYNREILGELKDLTSADEPYVRRSAVVGVEGLKKVGFNGVVRATGRDLKAFRSDELEEAKDWLVKGD